METNDGVKLITMVQFIFGLIFLIIGLLIFRSMKNTPTEKRNYYSYWQWIIPIVITILCGIIGIVRAIMDNI